MKLKSKPIPKTLTVRQTLAVLRDEVACQLKIVVRLRRRIKALETKLATTYTQTVVWPRGHYLE